MAEKSDSVPKAPKSSYKQLEELAQKNRTALRRQFEQRPEGFLAILTMGEEVYTGIGSNKTTAQDKAAEEALEIWIKKITPEKTPEKTPVTKLYELCQQNRKIKADFNECYLEVDEFVCKVIIKLENEEGKVVKEEEFEGKGKSKKNAKQNSASSALEGSSIIKSFTEVSSVVKYDVAEPSDRYGSKSGQTGYVPIVNYTEDRSSEPSDRYEWKSGQTGYVLIVNYTEDRPWADKDEEKIIQFMEKALRFQKRVENNLPKDELIKVLDETRRHLNLNSSAYHSFTFFLMGHGSQFGVKTADKGKKKKTISVEEIFDYLTNKALPNFTGKPKMIFLQCCRGESELETFAQPDSDEEKRNIIMVPEDGDIFIAYPTTEGHKAYRSQKYGSIFIYNCIKTFEENYTKMHLEDMMIDVKRVTALDPHGRQPNGRSQMPCTWSSLTKRFYFKPTIPGTDVDFIQSRSTTEEISNEDVDGHTDNATYNGERFFRYFRCQIL